MRKINNFKFHGFTRSPQTVMTRQTALLLLAFDDVWKQEKIRCAFVSGFDPSKHFHNPQLLGDLRDAVARPLKKVLLLEDVYAHLLFLSEHKIGDTDALVRNHAGSERMGQPIFQLGKAGEELCDIVNGRALRSQIEGHVRHWQALWLFARLVQQGECSPISWTPQNIASLTGLNRGQINKAIRMLNAGFVLADKAGAVSVFEPNCIENKGTRRHPIYAVVASRRVSKVPEIGDLDFGDDKTPNVDDMADAMNSVVDNLEVVDVPDPESVEVAEAEAEVMMADADLSDVEMAILLKETRRTNVSLDTLVTGILKVGVNRIQQAEELRQTTQATAARIAAYLREEEEAIEAFEAAAELLAQEARVKLEESEKKIAEARRRRASLRGDVTALFE